MELKTLWTYVVGGALAFFAVWFVVSQFSGPGLQLDKIANVEAIRDQFQQLRESKASKDDWFDFREQATEQLAEMTVELEDEVEGGDQTTIDLLRISRDFLPPLLRSSTDSKPKFADQYTFLMEKIHERQELAQQAQASRFGTVEKLVLLFDGLLVLVIGRWYLGRQ